MVFRNSPSAMLQIRRQRRRLIVQLGHHRPLGAVDRVLIIPATP